MMKDGDEALAKESLTEALILKTVNKWAGVGRGTQPLNVLIDRTKSCYSDSMDSIK